MFSIVEIPFQKLLFSLINEVVSLLLNDRLWAARLTLCNGPHSVCGVCFSLNYFLPIKKKKLCLVFWSITAIGV